MRKSFSSSVSDFSRLTKQAMTDIMRDSVQDVMEDAQLPKTQGGRMPVDTGNLRNTVSSGLNGELGEADSSYSVTIAEMEPGDVAQFAWTAEYALRMELGFQGRDALGRIYDQEGNHFLGGAVAKFTDYVAANARKHKV